MQQVICLKILTESIQWVDIVINLYRLSGEGEIFEHEVQAFFRRIVFRVELISFMLVLHHSVKCFNLTVK